MKLTYKYQPNTKIVTISNGRETREYTGQGFYLMMGYPEQNKQWIWDNWTDYTVVSRKKRPRLFKAKTLADLGLTVEDYLNK